jgi:hypothetical protein
MRRHQATRERDEILHTTIVPEGAWIAWMNSALESAERSADA